MTRIRPVTFPNRRGLTLVGMVHQPAAAQREIAIVLLSPGVKSRVAPHRLYNKFAAVLAELGFCVLRFDFYGLGDSDGQIEESNLQDFYGSVQAGRYVDDTTVALDWLQSEFGFREFILAGLCGGAITGLLAAQGDPRVVGLLGLGLPVMLQGGNVDVRRYMTAGQLNDLGRRSLRKLMSPSAWARLITFRSDYRLLMRAVAARFPAGRRPVAAQEVAQRQDNANPLVPPAVRRLVARGCRMLLVFSEADRLNWEFQEKYFVPHRSSLESYATLLQVDIVAGANHVLSFTEWQQDFFQRSQAWLHSHFANTTVFASTDETATKLVLSN